MDDEQQIHALFEAGDRALMSADIESLARIFADDYVQYDPTGQAFTKQEVLDGLRSGKREVPGDSVHGAANSLTWGLCDRARIGIG